MFWTSNNWLATAFDNTSESPRLNSSNSRSTHACESRYHLRPMNFFRHLLLVLALARNGIPAAAESPPKRVPPPGVQIPDADRKELEAGVAALAAEIKKLSGQSLLPDVQIFHKA